MTGGLIPTNTIRRLADLERQVENLQLQLDRLGGRSARQTTYQQVLLAKTTKTSSYPTASNTNTYEIVFLDGDYTHTSGNQTLSVTARSGSPQHVGHDIYAGNLIPENTNVLAVRQRALDGETNWWIVPPKIKPLVRFTLSATLATTDASKSATISNQYGPGVANSTSITVHNLLTHTAGLYVFEGDNGDAGLAFHDYGTNYRIIQMECP